MHCRLLQQVHSHEKGEQWQLMTWLKQPISYSQNLVSLRNLLQMQALIHSRYILTGLQDEHRVGYNIILSSPEQWPGGSMHKMHNWKCLDSKSNVNLALLQIQSIAICAGHPNPATLLFKRPIGDLVPPMSREAFNISIYDALYKALNAHHNKYLKDNDTWKILNLFLFSL